MNQSSEIWHPCARAGRFAKCQPPLPSVLVACLHFVFLNFSHQSFCFSFFVCFLTCFFMVCHNVELLQSLKAQSLPRSLLNLSGSSTLKKKKNQSGLKINKVEKKSWLGFCFVQGCFSRSNSCTTHLRGLHSCSKGKKKKKEKINAYNVSKITLCSEMLLRMWEASCPVNISHN